VVDTHDHIIRDTNISFPPFGPTQPCRAFIDPDNVCCSSWPGIPAYPLAVFRCTLRHYGLLWRVHCECCVRFDGALLMDCLLSSSIGSPHGDGVNLEMAYKAMSMRT
jgi:hypothetical protein